MTLITLINWWQNLNICKGNQTFSGIKFQKKDTFINKQCFSDRPLNTNEATKLSSTLADLCRFTVERFKGNRWSGVWVPIKPTYPRLIGKNKVTENLLFFSTLENIFWCATDWQMNFLVGCISSFTPSSLLLVWYFGTKDSYWNAVTSRFLL